MCLVLSIYYPAIILTYPAIEILVIWELVKCVSDNAEIIIVK